ncbi:uncharacterized protein TNCV_2455171 [Trichonephila clavipes]|nr:uncharacterized protein TNCV_2455171 [Trichonephila clavipes]
MKAPGGRIFGIAAPITCATLDAHPSTPLFGVVPCSEKTGLQRKVVFRDESRFNLSSDDNGVRVWRPRGERLNPAFALHRHTAPTAGVMVWGAIAYNTLARLVFIRGTITALTSCNHMCCPSCNSCSGPFFNKTMLGLTRKGCHKTVSALLLPFLSLPDPQICLQLNITGIIWDGELAIPPV